MVGKLLCLHSTEKLKDTTSQDDISVIFRLKNPCFRAKKIMPIYTPEVRSGAIVVQNTVDRVAGFVGKTAAGTGGLAAFLVRALGQVCPKARSR